jgi:rhodanese-related sulfurtransferase
MASFMSITGEELKTAIHEGWPLILDVREPDEFTICRIEGSINIPMGQVISRLKDLELDQPIVVVCHHGLRSAMTAKFLVSTGYEEVYNLVGGVEAWALEIDPSMPRY